MPAAHRSSPAASRPLAKLKLDEALVALPDDLVSAGQALRDTGDLKVDPQGNGLWVGKLPELEVELQLSGRAIKDYHCDCVDFVASTACAHLAALLAVVNLRKSPRVAAAPRRRKQQVSIRRLIDGVHEDDLRAFVQDYARVNNDFALDLKVRFAHDLPVADRFDQLLVRLLKRTSSSYSAKQAKRLTEALRQFSRKREEWLAESRWLDLFELNTALVSRLVVLVAKDEQFGIDLYAYLSACLSELGALLDSSPPPVLIERIEAWSTTELERGAYGRTGLDAQFYPLLQALGESLVDIRTRFEAAQSTYGVDVRRVSELMKLYYAAGENDAAERLLVEHLDEMTLVLSALEAEVAAGNFARAIKLAEAALEQQLGAPEQTHLRKFILAAAQNVERADLVVTHGPTQALAQQSLTDLNEVTTWLSDTDANEVNSRILEALDDHPIRADLKEDMRAELLSRLQRTQELEQLLYRSESPQLIERALPLLVGKLPDGELALLLDTKVREQLSQRFGKAPAEWVAKLLDGIARRSRGDFVPTLSARLRQDFKQRKSLLDALDDVLL